MEKSPKNYYFRLDIYRFIFTIFVVIVHFETYYRTLPNWYHLTRSLYRAVDFFFLLSGFLLYKSFITQHYTNALDFTFAKLKRLLPLNFVVVIFTCFFVNFTPAKNLSGVLGIIRNFLHHLISAVPELLFLQEFIPVFTIFCEGDYFIATWYISVMLVSGFIWFWILTTSQKKYGNSFKPYGWGLILSIIIFSYIFNEYKQLNISQSFIPGLNLPSGFLRGLAVMGLGIFCANFRININNKKILNVLKFLIPALLLIICFYAAGTAIDFVFVILCAFVLMFEFSLKEIPCKLVQTICRFAGKISLPIYFSHIFVIIFLYTPIIQKWDLLYSNFPLDLLVRTVLVCTVSSIFYVISKFLEKPLNRLYSCFISENSD
ncbi:MAG: acyltransferase family protein [Spirochaetaceae bacterium]|nr:acyltransferase family protein [Spirochaetaceae bacterium]